MLLSMAISIHTTRKVVTPFASVLNSQEGISIHTTRKVVTSKGIHGSGIFQDFNPHHPQGGDRPWLPFYSIHQISIHTTRKVVTQVDGGTWGCKGFQSTPPARWWQQFCTKTTLNSYSSSPTIHTQFTLHLTFFHIKKQPQAISHQNSGTNPPGISCALQVRTKKSEALSH